VSDVSAKIDESRVEDILNVGAELIFALGASRNGKQEEQGKEGIHAFHINVDAKSGAREGWAVVKGCA
jgi:hypothetical protein